MDGVPTYRTIGAALAAAPPALSTAEETPERDRYVVLVRCGAFSVRDAA